MADQYYQEDEPKIRARSILRVCTKCRESLPLTHFFERRKIRASGKVWTGHSANCRTCMAGRWADWYEKNANKVCAKVRVRTASKMTDPAEREAKRVRDLTDYRKHRDTRLAKRAEYYHGKVKVDPVLRENEKRSKRAHRLANPDAMRAIARNRSARVRNAAGKHTAQDVIELIDIQQGCCFWCGTSIPKGKHQVDHFVPIARGGSNGRENLVIACAACNQSKNAMMPDDFWKRLQCLSPTSPAPSPSQLRLPKCPQPAWAGN